MPGIVRKLLVIVAADGLILQPITHRKEKTLQPIRIEYGSSTVSNLQTDTAWQHESPVLEVHGIVGILTVSSASYLVSISRRKHVAQLWGKPVYAVKDVNITPLSSQKEAIKSVTQAANVLNDRAVVEDSEIPADLSSLSDSADTDSIASLEGPPQDALSPGGKDQEPPLLKGPSSIAQDVIRKKGVYGRFANKWFSKGGWTSERRRPLGMSRSGDAIRTQISAIPISSLELGTAERTQSPVIVCGEEEPPNVQVEAGTQSLTKEKAWEDEVASLMPRLIATTKLLFSSNTFFFSYEVDITRSLATQQSSAPKVPLFKQADPQYFWNRHLTLKFAEYGLDDYILPVMQGFVSQTQFTIENSPNKLPRDSEASARVTDVVPFDRNPESESSDASRSSTRKSFLLTLISRRSVRRAGLRYLRRGIDEDGNVANSVETEQLLSSPSWDVAEKTYSFLQTRGSIPLLFSQKPYSFKPVPVIHGSVEANQKALKKHFTSLISRYGLVHIVSLLDKHGSEIKIGDSYEENVKIMNSEGGINGRNVDFQWFDFHNVCKGMKFENVSKLVDDQSTFLSTSGWTVQQNGNNISNQSGITRTNCMDCLDRTNVVQSAFARCVLENQLCDQGVSINLETDPATSWFNYLWADNGDAISRAYTSTSALKGDYTRTRKRNIGGALTDFSLTLTRYYNNIFNDYFGQACIDYLLGNVTQSVFEEFESNMMSADPAIDVQKLRQHALDTCVEIVVEDTEDLIGGWPLSCPQQPNTIKTFPFEDCILLLTDAAIYACRFDWNAEIVKSFERIPLGQITHIQRGAYITSTFAPVNMDVNINVGFVISFRPSHDTLPRVYTRSLQNEETGSVQLQQQKPNDQAQVLAFKALPARSSVVHDATHQAPALNERTLVVQLCDDVQRAAKSREHTIQEHTDTTEMRLPFIVEDRDVVSLGEAKQSTGFLQQIGNSLIKIVWG